jgi:uncharacterized protein (DUF2267 family)
MDHYNRERGNPMNKDEFVKKVMERGNIQDKMVAERGVQIGTQYFKPRLFTRGTFGCCRSAAKDLKRIWNNLSGLQTILLCQAKNSLNYRHKSNYKLIENEILRENLPLHPEQLTQTVFHVLKEQITPGKSEDIEAELPEEVREFYKAA